MFHRYYDNYEQLAYTVLLHMFGIQIQISLLNFFSESHLYDACILLLLCCFVHVVDFVLYK